jgi:hypothetical protein
LQTTTLLILSLQHKTKDVITLFHKSGTPASTKVLNLLKQVSANASEAATEDQASDHSAQTHPQRAEFDLDVTEKAPTSDQLMTILDYVGTSRISSVVNGATTVEDALKKFKQDSESFKRPVVSFLIFSLLPTTLYSRYAWDLSPTWTHLLLQLQLDTRLSSLPTL